MNFLQQAYERVRARVTGQAPVLQEPVAADEVAAMCARTEARRARAIAALGAAYVGVPRPRKTEVPEYLRDQRQPACD